MADKSIEVTLNVEGTVYDITTKPYKAKTAKKESEQVTLQWTAKGGTFPATNYFRWKPNTIPPPATPTRTSATQLDLTYTVPPSPDGTVTWEYTICVTDGSITICEDPEAENTVPPDDDWATKEKKDKKEREDEEP